MHISAFSDRSNKIIPYKLRYGIRALNEDHASGVYHNNTVDLQNYKPPGVKDIPIDFRVYLRKKAPNPFGVLRSKGSVTSFYPHTFCFNYFSLNSVYIFHLMISQ
jgi:hypothetical protein